MRRKITRTALSLSTLALLITGAVLYAGPLNPPAGPVASTSKTLTEVEPRIAINATNTPGDNDSFFKVTASGSYYLTGNITGVVGKHGIEIVASGVTLDLNGFEIAGVSGGGPADGVRANASGLMCITIVNGSIRNWGDDGIDLGQFSTTGCRIEGVQVSSNVRMGIYAGMDTSVSKCSASGSRIGIQTQSGSSVSDCSAIGNSEFGIAVSSGSTVSNCSVYLNGFGIAALNGCTVTSCSAYQNTADGVTTGSGCSITNCCAYDNTQDGITTATNCTLHDCSVSGNNRNGIRIGNGCKVSHCSAGNNVINGILTTDGCKISDCTATDNLARGISVNNGCQITACLTRNNQFDGMSVNFSCTVTGNTCNGDGTAVGSQGGIRVLGQANRIEANNVTYADRGLLVDSGSNVIIRNTVKGCTLNWSIVADNYYGAIVDRTGVAAAAVAGNAAPSTVATTDPHANFTY